MGRSGPYHVACLHGADDGGRNHHRSQQQLSSALIGVDGILVPEDVDQFRAKVAGVKKAAVIFRGDGGSLYAAIRIGNFIRSKNWLSYVPADVTCASACALADPTARIGFHAAGTNEGGQVTETSFGNALIGAYLNEIGMREDAILYITSADPRSMRWLSAEDAAAFGIELENLPTFNALPPAPAASSSNRTLKQRR